MASWLKELKKIKFIQQFLQDASLWLVHVKYKRVREWGDEVQAATPPRQRSAYQ